MKEEMPEQIWAYTYGEWADSSSMPCDDDSTEYHRADTVPRWVSVDDRLPPRLEWLSCSRWVPVTSGGIWYMGRHDYCANAWCGDGGHEVWPSHWLNGMPEVPR